MYLLTELCSRINAELEQRKIYLTSGQPNTFADYQHGVGFYQGLQAALAIIDKLEDDINKANG